MEDPTRAAFDRTAGLRAAVDASALPRYALDAVYASAQALAIARRLAPYRDELAALPRFDLGHLDRLEDLANALLYAHVALVARASRVRQLPALAAEAYPLRALLLAYADLLVRAGRVPAEPVARLRAGSGYRALVEDLAALVRILREVPGAVGPAAPVTDAELDRASDLVRAMTLELGTDGDPDLPRHVLATERAKLGALLARSHAQLLRAMRYLRFDEGDAASLVPALYVPTKSPRRRGGVERSEEVPNVVGLTTGATGNEAEGGPFEG